MLCERGRAKPDHHPVLEETVQAASDRIPIESTMAIQDVPDEMLACQVVEFNKPYKIHKVATPKELGDHDLLVKVAVASLCHTDGMVTAGTFGTKLPCTASHEGTGTVVAKGSEAHDFQVGDRVMCGIYRNPCGVCLDCQGPENFRQYCSKMMGAIGIHLDGAFAEYVVADARHACRLPDKITFETAAPLACAGCTIWRGVLQAELKKGEWLCLVGSGGGLGHLGVQFGKALGLNVIGVDAREEGLGLTKQAGADVVVDARKGDDHVVAEIHRVTSGAGADATVNVSDAPTAAATACAATKRHGTMIQIAQVKLLPLPQ